jgi:hypothetical protein
VTALDFGLRFEGMPEATIQHLDAQLPALERLAAAAKQAEPMLTPLLPVVQKAWPDIVAVTPLLLELIAFAKSKQASG